MILTPEGFRYMHNTAQCGTRIREMFASIAPRYDFLNRLLSLGTDKRWRQAAVERLVCQDGGTILDIATGTGDMVLATASRTDGSDRIVGTDFCGEMVEIARAKISDSAFGSRISLAIAACEALPFRDACFDAVTIAFGIRNVVDRKMGLYEICRVLKPGGRLVVLEFSTPRAPCFRPIYGLYLRRLLPAVGGLFSNFGAYRYLPESVRAFPDREAFEKLMVGAGFAHTFHTDLSFGIVTVFQGEKPLTSP
jgi:demethylmenaquinone methyltransferase / 2-methoxy-6-polyprenyl-1,4-benzoquinol methylase